MAYALVWGASGGIGRAIVTALRERDMTVLAVARNTRELDAAGVETYHADLARDADVAAAALWAAQHSAGEVAAWVYAAGDMYGGALADTSQADWQRLMAANVGGAHSAVSHSLALVPGGGHLIFVGAYVDKIMLPKLGAYAAGKAALDAYVTVLGKELRDRKVTNIRVGAVDTPLWDKAPFKLPRGAHPASVVAAAVVRALDEGIKGQLDL